MSTSSKKAHILVVDDEPDLRTLYELILLRLGHEVSSASSLAEAESILGSTHFDIVLIDMRLPDGLGIDLIKSFVKNRRKERFIVITAYGSTENAIVSLKAGAFDYLSKPVDINQLRNAVFSAMQQPISPTDPVNYHPEVSPSQQQKEEESTALRQLTGNSEVIQKLRDRIQKVAPSMAPVLIIGESGTGKELVAKALHQCSHRAHAPFIAVNCSAIPESLFEAEFFGSQKGSYTGSTQNREGFFQAAHDGTLFLDEIGDIPLTMQSKLLRAIQERSVRAIGSNTETPVNVRIISATHKNLQQAVADGLFRQDLYFRLNVIDICPPALRDRREDLTLICAHVMRRISTQNQSKFHPISALGMQRLRAHPFPGNVRELENLLHRAMTLSDWDLDELAYLDEATISPTPPILSSTLDSAQQAPHTHDHKSDLTLQQQLDEKERAMLQSALEESGFNRSQAAKKLGITLRQIRYRMARFGIDSP